MSVEFHGDHKTHEGDVNLDTLSIGNITGHKTVVSCVWYVDAYWVICGYLLGGMWIFIKWYVYGYCVVCVFIEWVVYTYWVVCVLLLCGT